MFCFDFTTKHHYIFGIRISLVFTPIHFYAGGCFVFPLYLPLKPFNAGFCFVFPLYLPMIFTQEYALYSFVFDPLNTLYAGFCFAFPLYTTPQKDFRQRIYIHAGFCFVFHFYFTLKPFRQNII